MKLQAAVRLIQHTSCGAQEPPAPVIAWDGILDEAAQTQADTSTRASSLSRQKSNNHGAAVMHKAPAKAQVPSSTGIQGPPLPPCHQSYLRSKGTQ